MRPPRSLFAMGLSCLLVGLVLAQDSGDVIVPGVSKTASSRLADTRNRLSDKRIFEAAGMLQSLIESSGNELVQVPEGRSVAARWLCHVQIRRLGKAGLGFYRSRVEGQARKLLDQANFGN